MTDLDDRLAALEARVQELADTLDVMRVIASYAPSVDGGAPDVAGLIWTEDSRYESDNADEPLIGRAPIVELAERIGGLPMGVAHFFNLPLVTLDGDRAVVTAESNTYHQDGDRYVVARVSSNRWELDRVDGTWLIRNRVNRLLDGSPGARDLLARGARESLS
ncbi:MAG: nuclear transport factor 2 family protein [Acidimicrobiia bacterium]